MDVVLEQVSIKFDQVTAVDRLSVTIKSGELVALLGPSGCGKSTTLFLLSGLYQPTEGRIYFGEQDVTVLDPEKRQIGMVFQNYALYPHLTVLKNIMFPLKMQKVPKKEAKERAVEMARLVQIDHLLERKPAQLSGGQQQRVAIARALVKQPKLLLLDEPLSNLDARLRLEMREEIRRIQQEVGITTVFVTHDQEEALSISDRVILMKDGLLQQDERPQAMYLQPHNEFVARFLGNPPINMIDAVYDGEQHNLVLTAAEQSIPFSAASISDQQRIRLGVRAEDLFLSSPDQAVLSGEVTYWETIGRDTLLRVRCGATTVRALVNPDIVTAVGDQVHFDIRQGRLHLFDAETGVNILQHKGGAPVGSEAQLEKHA
jgi:multiple sugar transport system ATP-binding protein